MAMDTTQCRSVPSGCSPNALVVHDLTKKNMSGELDPAAFFVGVLQWITTSCQCWAVKNWNKDQKMLSFWAIGSFFFASTWMGPDTEGSKCSSPCSTSWQWTWSKLMAALAKKRWSQSMRLAKPSFPVSGCQPIVLRGGRRGDTPKRCSIPLRGTSFFLPISDEDEIHAVWASGGLRGAEDKKYGEDQNSQWKGMMV